MRVGAREGVCRDFAVLGYCEKGLDCEHQHVRECPDFAEKGACTTKGCKLPHVIRANRNRPRPAPAADASADPKASSDPAASSSGADLGSGDTASSQALTAEDAQLGDEYISLTFHESDPEEDEDEEDDEEESDGEEQPADEAEEEETSQHSSPREEQ